MRIEPNPISRVRETSATHRASGLSHVPASDESSSVTESVQLSELASLLARLAEVPSERAESVAIIRQRLVEGYYDSDSAIRAAAEQLAENLDWLTGLPPESTNQANR